MDLHGVIQVSLNSNCVPFDMLVNNEQKIAHNIIDSAVGGWGGVKAKCFMCNKKKEHFENAMSTRAKTKRFSNK